MQKIRTLVTAFVIGLALVGIQAIPAAAIESSGIGALPAHPRSDNPRTKSIFVYDIESNDVVTDGIKVINNTDSTKTLMVYPVDSQTSSDGAFACAQKVDTRTGVGNWIKLAEQQVTVPANGSQTVPFTLTAPESVTAGEHNGCIVVQDVEPSPKNTGGVVLSFRSALRVAVTTPGALQSNLRFVDVLSRSVNQTTYGVSPILKNTGNISADANIDVRLTGILGMRYPFSSIDGQFPVFPGVNSRFNFELEKPFWGGWFNRDVEAHYRKSLSSGQLSDDVINIKAKSAIVFIEPQPLALAIEIGIALLLIGLIFYIIHRRRLRRLRLVSTKNYTVKEGETIDSIAKDFRIKWRKLAKINHVKKPYTLHAKQVIEVPSMPRPWVAAPASLDTHKPPKGTKPTDKH